MTVMQPQGDPGGVVGTGMGGSGVRVHGRHDVSAVVVCGCSVLFVAWCALVTHLRNLAIVMPFDSRHFMGRGVFSATLVLVEYVAVAQYMAVVTWQIARRLGGRTTLRTFWTGVGFALGVTLALLAVLQWGAWRVEHEYPWRTLVVREEPGNVLWEFWTTENLPCGCELDREDGELYLRLYPRLNDAIVSEAVKKLNEAGWEVEAVE